LFVVRLLLAKGRLPQAAAELTPLVSKYPKSANVYDSLGDAYQAAGRKDDAIKSYEKALAIDPNYPSSVESIRKLRGS